MQTNSTTASVRVDFNQRADVTAVNCSLAPLVTNPMNCKHYTSSHCASLCVSHKQLTRLNMFTSFKFYHSRLNATKINIHECSADRRDRGVYYVRPPQNGIASYAYGLVIQYIHVTLHDAFVGWSGLEH